ncbi:hypothetical protein SLOPH_2626 [Spraguea lophii 42_110]|uniref:Uncharacterized protein n=1 Tax=Spraguea lophii (strain 42_110) TaxID=1358809 RepID=S7XV53_SPRLO|nr:hypothetical protein SLOPH_2626 [Spraguea lophii 42_110]
MILLDEIENENKRMRYASKIENYLQLKLKEKKIDVKEESNNPVNKDILKFSKQLKQRVKTFNKMLEDDEDVVQSVHSNYSEQITQTESNIKNLDKIDTSSVSSGFVTVVLIFIIMYVFIRTF